MTSVETQVVTLELTARAILVLTFTVSAWAKVRAPQPLLSRLRTLGFSAPLARVLHRLVLFVEVGLVLLLVGAPELPFTPIAVTAVLTLFSISIVARPLKSGCGCGTPGEDLPAWALLWRNALLVWLTVPVAVAGISATPIVFPALAAPATVIAVIVTLRHLTEATHSVAEAA